jgi:antagonist of KipI
MSLTFVKEGILNTLQDRGRKGFRRFGINPNGVMDHAAARIVNALLGNDENEGVLEMHFPAGEIRFDREAVIAIGGANFSPAIDTESIPNWRTIRVKKNDTIRFASKLKGERTYLAVRGGFKIDDWLGSKSTNLTACIGGFEGRRLRIGDAVGFNSVRRQLEMNKDFVVSNALLPLYSPFPTVRFIPGAEFELLSEQSRKKFRSNGFIISKNSDRMGYRLQGDPIALVRPLEMITSTVGFGTIQLLPDGQLIVLMADHQTSGGYPRIAHVIDRDLPLMAQLGPNNKVAFHQVSIDDAEALMLEFERDLMLLKTGVKLLGR